MFVSVKFCDLVCPSTTLPKSKLAGATPNPACPADPLTGMVKRVPLQVLPSVTLPVTLPAAVGANTTVNVTVSEGFTVIGNAMPFTLIPVPVAARLVICTGAVPVLVTAICCVALLPVGTFPKLRDAGFACNFQPAGADPVPPNDTVVLGLLGSLLVIAKVALAAPATFG